MIIDDDYCQYDTFRIINKADVDALAQFKVDEEKMADPAMRMAALKKWEAKLAEEQEKNESTEEGVYALTYAQRMVNCWTNVLK